MKIITRFILFWSGLCLAMLGMGGCAALDGKLSVTEDVALDSLHAKFTDVRFGEWTVTELYEEGEQIKERPAEDVTFTFVKPTIREWLNGDGCTVVLWCQLQGTDDGPGRLVGFRDGVLKVATDAVPGWTIGSIETWPEQCELPYRRPDYPHSEAILFGTVFDHKKPNGAPWVKVESSINASVDNAVWVGLRMVREDELNNEWNPPVAEEAVE